MHRTAFSLLEVFIATAMLALIITMVSQSLDMGVRFRERVELQNDLNNRANDLLNKLSIELRNVKSDATLQLDSGTGIYKYIASKGIKTVSPYTADWEATQRQLIYDSANRQLRWIRPGFASPGEILTSDLDTTNGFLITQAGATLQIQLKMRVSTSRKTGLGTSTTGEDVIYSSQSRVLFLRSTLDTSSGSPAVTKVQDTEDSDGAIAATGTCLPSIFYGNMVTRLGLTAPFDKQITMVIAPLIGQKLRPVTGPNPSPAGIWVRRNDNTASWYTTSAAYNDGAINAGGTDFDLVRSTSISASGTTTVTLTGKIAQPVQIWCAAWDSNNNYTVEIWDY